MRYIGYCSFSSNRQFGGLLRFVDFEAGQAQLGFDDLVSMEKQSGYYLSEHLGSLRQDNWKNCHPGSLCS